MSNNTKHQERDTEPTLDQLPDSTHVKAIQTALWSTDEKRGAAVMIGAGLTRTADKAAHDAPPPPLWNDLAATMAKDLYSNDGKHSQPTNPLTIAQEYEAHHGRNALDTLIRTSINDQTLTPGPLHKSLLELPWTDILTTNWDTLLERTADNNPQRHYDRVFKPSDIPRTRAPRIIKLHGTLPSNTPFISTEEDFRTYPQRFAPFVNLTQQILMENVLCLIGFSGEDPNFIQWTGWARDNLGKHAPPIYLVGALNLAQPTRRRLEDRGVKPIDLTPLLTHLEPKNQHAAAIKTFLKALKKAEPWPAQHWPTQPQQKRQTKKDKPLLETWKELHHNYPGWIVPPQTTRIKVHLETLSKEEALNKTLETATTEEQHALLYEYAWRLDIELKPLPKEILEQLGEAATGTSLERTKREELACWLLRNAREQEDQKAFTKWERWIEHHAPHLQHHVTWERCLRARDNLNLKAIEEHLPLINGRDPIWGLRRAALHAELNNKEQASNEALNALRELRTRQAQDRHSIWIASRLAWALFFCRALASPWNKDKRVTEELGEQAKEWPTELTALRCDPWQERQGIRDELREALERSQRATEETTYSFDPGQATRITYSFPRSQETAHIQARRLFDQAGIPRGIQNLNLTRNEIKTTIKIEGTTTPTQITRLVSIHPDDKLIDKHLSRLAIARLPIAIVDETISTLRPALTDTIRRYKQTADEGWEERGEWINRAAEIAEVLSRLIIRTNTTTIQQTIEEVFKAIRETPEHRTLSRKLNLLIIRGIETLPPEEQASFLLAAIELPLPGEDGAENPDPHLPETIGAFTKPEPDRAVDEHQWNRRIADLTKLVTKIGLVRQRAIYRLMKLHDWKLLTSNEQQTFAEALWVPPAGENKLPLNTGLYNNVILALPEPTPGLARRAFEHDVIDLNQPHQPMAEDLVAVLNAARYNPDSCRYQLSRPQAQAWLARITEKLVHFSTSTEKEPRFSPTEQEQFLEWAGHAVAGAILPILTPNDVSDEIIDQLVTAEAPGIVVALPGLVALKPSLHDSVVDRLRHLLVSTDAAWGYASAAVLEWSRLDQEGKSNLPEDLVNLVSGAVLSRHRITLASTLGAATELLRHGRFSDTDQARLESGLTYLLADLDYAGKRIAAYDEVSLLRARCATLALALKQAGRNTRIIDDWLSTAAHDPLPDVRYAAHDKR